MRIRFDYNNMLAENVGSAGITEADIMNMRPRFTKPSKICATSARVWNGASFLIRIKT